MLSKIIVGIIAIICLLLVIRKVKKNSNKIEYQDKTIKNYKRWHK